MDVILELKTDDIYLNKKRAQFFSCALINAEDYFLPYITSGQLDKWTHNMTLQLSANSKGVKNEKKEMYISLRR